MRKIPFITLILLATTVSALGQNLYQKFDYVTVTGKVMSRGGDPVVNCMVEIRTVSQGGSEVDVIGTGSRNVSKLNKAGWGRTDEKGIYLIKGIPSPGRYLVVVKGAKGFKKTQIPVSVDSGQGKAVTVNTLVLDKYQDIDSKTRKLLGKSSKLLKKGDLDGAEKLLLEANARNGNLSEVHISLGNIHLKKKNYKDALTEFTKAFDLGDKSPALCMTSAKIAFSMKRFKESAEFIDAFLESNPKDLMGLYVGGISYFNMKKFKEAEPYFKRYADIKGSENHDVNFLYVYGMTEDALGHYESAADLLNKAYQNGWRASPVFLETLANAYLKQKKKAEAKVILKELLEKFPEFDGRKIAEDTYNSL
ncbi:MAG: hypothetical protein CO090_04805 [Acidobacteria bacterium CG_4_9_14_3_um_filter_49_7]|nr:MAG: hypothetical protein CO090_04805 [Acidobacteria bacterium CG_4_9_14_3_um_filter_49_7]